MPPLPQEQVNYRFLFENTGVDHMGCLYYRDPEGIKKAYIILFACSATCAVHLELVPSLSADDFLMALRRFTSHHSMPRLILSDNTANFKPADMLLQELGRHPDVEAFFASHSLWWQFQMPRMPRAGSILKELCLQSNLR